MSREEVLRITNEGERFAVTCHRRPDADALGSALGWAAALRSIGKEAVVYSVDTPPRMLRFLDVGEVESAPPAGRFDACFVMDAAARALVPDMPDGLEGPVVMFDHHAAHDDFGDVILREPDAAATGVLVVRVMRELGIEGYPPGVAEPLYAAIVADTGGFRYPATSPETLRLAAELVEAGAAPWTTAYHLFEGWEPARMKLLGAILDDMEIALDGRLAVQRVTREMLTRLGADDEMVEGMVNYGRMLEGVEISALVWEMDKDGRRETKVSLRSSGDADVSRIAAAMNGGGHRSAAGANVPDDLATTEAKVVALAKDLLGDAD